MKQKNCQYPFNPDNCLAALRNSLVCNCFYCVYNANYRKGNINPQNNNNDYEYSEESVWPEEEA